MTQKQDEPAVEVRNDQDHYREIVGQRASEIVARIREERDQLDTFKEVFKTAKTDVEEQKALIAELEGDLHQLALDMAAINEGTYTPAPKQQKLPFNASASPEKQIETNASKAPLAELLKHGCPKGLMSALESSQLASERKLQTVGDLLAAIQADDYWFKKIKGMGEDRRDKLIDSLTSWGAANPETESDTRPKQCLDHDCQQSESKGIFVKHDDGGEACPSCGNSNHWQRYEEEAE